MHEDFIKPSLLLLKIDIQIQWVFCLILIVLLCLALIMVLRKKIKIERELKSVKDRHQSELHAGNQALKESEVKYKYTLDRMMEGVQIIDFNYRYLYVNTVVAEHGKSTPEKLIGKTMMESYPGIENTALFRAIETCMKERVPQLIENEFVFPDLSVGWFELSIQPVIEGIFILSIDITKRKKIQEEINQLNEILEEKVEERTRQLAVINKELEAFSYSVSHDLRAPLRAIHGYSKMIEEDYAPKLDDEARRLLGNIQYYSDKMGKLIDDLLSFSRIGKKEIQKTNIDMNKLVAEIIHEVEAGVLRKPSITVHNLPDGTGDPSLLRQVWFNLISNALKYSAKKSKPEVEIGANQNTNEVIYFVKDNGAGFDMKYSHRLFGVFQRLHTPEDFEGTGIGLAIVQRIISKHEGKVWFEAEPDKGAVFYFSLPKAS